MRGEGAALGGSVAFLRSTVALFCESIAQVGRSQEGLDGILAAVERRLALKRLVTSGPTNSCRASTNTDVVAGEPARITRHRCTDMDYVGSSLTHADRGYYFTMGFRSGDTTTKTTLESIVDSIGFADH
jgi:hypothetical protein